ncbi:MAG: hypothetical protein O9341_17305 [Paucibacter sp.]|nr:hypothetical protein [Roseateles sp.]
MDGAQSAAQYRKWRARLCQQPEAARATASQIGISIGLHDFGNKRGKFSPVRRFPARDLLDSIVSRSGLNAGFEPGFSQIHLSLISVALLGFLEFPA